MLADEGASRQGSVRLVLPCVVLVVLQLVLGGHLKLFGASADFLLVIVGLLALMRGDVTGCVAGFVCGLAFDLLGSGMVGLTALLGSVLGFAVGRASRSMAEGWAPRLALFAVADLALNVAYLIFLTILGVLDVGGWAVLGRVVASTVADVAVAAITFFLVFGHPRLGRGKRPELR